MTSKAARRALDCTATRVLPFFDSFHKGLAFKMLT